MREIRFRAWLYPYKRMAYEFNLFQKKGCFHLWLPGEEYSPNAFELMQYTGLKDKNGKEIWEEDILKVTCGCGHQENLPVESKDGYNGYFLRARWQHNWDNDQLRLNWAERLEVIGNIWENRELLNDNKGI